MRSGSVLGMPEWIRSKPLLSSGAKAPKAVESIQLAPKAKPVS